MKILVTGGTGFIGEGLCEELIKRNYEVIILDIIPPKDKFKKIEYIQKNIGDEELVNLSVWDKIDFCFHLAAMANVDEVREDRNKAFMVNVFGTFNIVEACRKHDIPLAFISTACVYGNTPQHPSTEEGPTFPVDWYGVTKRAGEEFVKGLLNKWLILRFGTTFGSEMRPALATHIFLTQAIKGEPYTIKGTGNQSRNWIYIDDLTDGCVKAMEYHIRTGKNEIFNLVGEKTYSVNELAEICHRIVGNKKFKKIFLSWRPDDVKMEDISVEKAKLLLDWKPKIDLEEGMRIIYKQGINKKHL